MEGAGTGGGAAEVEIQNPCRYPEAAEPALAGWIASLLAAVAPEAESFTARFTSDREMRRLNRTYRGKDYPTDVLSFPGEQTPEGRHLGDVVICVPVARRQAEERSHPAERELRLLLLHGILHCLGHDHETDDGTMERLEETLRTRWLAREELPEDADD